MNIIEPTNYANVFPVVEKNTSNDDVHNHVVNSTNYILASAVPIQITSPTLTPPWDSMHLLLCALKTSATFTYITSSWWIHVDRGTMLDRGCTHDTDWANINPALVQGFHYRNGIHENDARCTAQCWMDVGQRRWRWCNIKMKLDQCIVCPRCIVVKR